LIGGKRSVWSTFAVGRRADGGCLLREPTVRSTVFDVNVWLTDVERFVWSTVGVGHDTQSGEVDGSLSRYLIPNVSGDQILFECGVGVRDEDLESIDGSLTGLESII